MAILTLAEWWDNLPIRQVTWSLPAVGDVVETRGGAVQVIETTSRQWEIAIALAPEALDRGREIEALIDMAARPGTVVEVTTLPWRGPAGDPDGAAISGATVTVDSVATDGRSITLAGLPANYTLASGDHLSIETTGANGGRIVRLYRLHGGGVADGTGLLGPVPVSPRIDPVVQAGQAVRLYNPIALAVLLPSDLRRGRIVPGRYDGATITLRQTLAEVQP